MAFRNSLKEEKEIYSINYEDILKRMTQSDKPIMSKPESEKELQLELEISDSLKDLIASPSKTESVLLDIEIIKPCRKNHFPPTPTPDERKTINKFTKSLINGEHSTKKLINSFIPRSRQQIPTFKVNAISTGNVGISSAYKSRRRPCNKRSHRAQDTSAKNVIDIPILQEEERQTKLQPSRRPVGEKMVKRTLMDELKDLHLFKNVDDVTEQVYATLNYKKVRAQYPCKNFIDTSLDNEKNPCPCHNCAVVGLLMDSQKRPIYTPSLDNLDISQGKGNSLDSNNTPTGCKPNNKKLQQTSKLEDYNSKLKLLIKKLQLLETRLQHHEETTVSRECFIRIVNKIIEYIDLLDKNEKKCIADRKESLTGKEEDPKRNSKSRKANKKTSCRINCLQQKNNQLKDKAINTNVLQKQKPNCTNSSFFKNHKYLLYWGEEIITPGFDLKCKIVDLFNKQIQNRDKGKFTNRSESDIHSSFKRTLHEEPSKNFSNFVKEYLQRKLKGAYQESNFPTKERDIEREDPCLFPQDQRNIIQTTTTKTECVREEVKVNMAYLNPNFNLRKI